MIQIEAHEELAFKKALSVAARSSHGEIMERNQHLKRHSALGARRPGGLHILDNWRHRKKHRRTILRSADM